MERGTSGGQQQQSQSHHPHHHQQQQQQQHHHHQQQQHQSRHQHVVSVHSYDPYMIAGDADEEHTSGTSSFDNPATKKKPPKLKPIHRSLSMAIDNYAPIATELDLDLDDGFIVHEQPLIHRSASPLPVRSSAPPPQTLALPAQQQQQHTIPQHIPGGGSGSVSPALSARQHHHLQQQQQQQHHQQQQHQQHQLHMHTFQQLAAQAAAARHHQLPHTHAPHQHRQHTHPSSSSSPTLHAVSPVQQQQQQQQQHHQRQQQQQHQPDIYLVSSSSSLGDNVGGLGMGLGLGRSQLGGSGSTSPIQFIDVDDMLPRAAAQQQQHHPHPHPHPHAQQQQLKKNLFRRSDTIDVHPSTNFQMKKTHSFHAQQDPAAMEQIQLAVAAGSATSSRRTSSVRANFLMPGPPAGKEISRSPSPSRRGCRSHRSFNDPGRRPSSKPESVVESQIRHPSLNDDLLEPLDGRSLFPPTNLSLENELFVESRSRSNSHTKMEELGVAELAAAAVAVQRMRKSSGSFDETAPVLAAGHSATHPPAASASNSIKQKREPHPHSRQQSTHSLELDGRPSTSSAAAHTMQLHSAAAAASAAYHFKRGAQHGRSLYLSPSNLEELTVHRPGLLAAAAAFQGTNASASVKQAKALHSASVRLRSYREALSATKKSKSFIAEASGATSAGDDFELGSSSPHRRNSRPLSTAVPSVAAGTAAVVNVDEIKRSPRPITAAAVAAAFIEEKRPSFERKSSLTYEHELTDAAFAAQVLRPFHHKLAAGRKASLSGGSHKLKKKSLSDDTDEDEEADRKRKRIVCIVLATVLLCLVCASVFVLIVTLTSGQSQSGKKSHTFSRDTPVHYTGMRPS
ncbi:box A-binding factor [Drosophila novamexicana]|uniref:box A-binding factor n=1 Tax=Drosophila novamexicana TaxID=47314 RepID=UPI0011E5B910|nr:box A-binding factor [Drosophila novamexicana]